MPVLEVGLLMVRAPLAPLKIPVNVNVIPLGALMVDAPLMVIGLLKLMPSTEACKMVDAAMVNGLDELPKAESLPTLSVPLFKAILVFTVFA